MSQRWLWALFLGPGLCLGLLAVFVGEKLDERLGRALLVVSLAVWAVAYYKAGHLPTNVRARERPGAVGDYISLAFPMFNLIMTVVGYSVGRFFLWSTR